MRWNRRLRVDQFGRVGVRQPVHHFLVDLGQVVQQPGWLAHRGEVRGQPFEVLADEIDGEDIVDGHRCDDAAGVYPMHGQALVGKASQRFADRSAAHAQVLSELVLAQPIAWHETAVQDRFTQRVGHQLRRRTAVRDREQIFAQTAAGPVVSRVVVVGHGTSMGTNARWHSFAFVSSQAVRHGAPFSAVRRFRAVPTLLHSLCMDGYAQLSDQDDRHRKLDF